MVFRQDFLCALCAFAASAFHSIPGMNLKRLSLCIRVSVVG